MNPCDDTLFHPGVTKAVKEFCDFLNVSERHVSRICGLGVICKKGDRTKQHEEWNLELTGPSHLPDQWLDMAYKDLDQSACKGEFAFNGQGRLVSPVNYV